MYDFWNDVEEDALEEGKVASDSGVMPENAVVDCVIEKIEYFDSEDNVTVNAMWRVTGKDFTNRVIFHKMMIDGNDTFNPEKSETKRKRSRQMFALIVRLAGANKIEQLLRSGTLPTPQQLTMLVGTKGRLMLGVWNFNGKTGNWVKSLEKVTNEPVVNEMQTRKDAPKAADLDDEIPF